MGEVELICKIKKNIIPLFLMSIIPIVNVFYAILNNSNRKVYILVTEFDKAMPFIAVFSVPYYDIVSFYNYMFDIYVL